MDDSADLRLADHVAAAVCDDIAAVLRTTADPVRLARHLGLLRLVWAGEATALTGHALDALAAEIARHRLLAIAPSLAGATFPAGAVRTLLALASGLAAHLPPPSMLAVGGDPATHLVLAPAQPGLAWPPALTAALGDGGGSDPVAHALRIACAAGWRPQLLFGAAPGTPPLLLAASA